jgi:hypothetical protein
MVPEKLSRRKQISWKKEGYNRREWRCRETPEVMRGGVK